ncbi:hypothetical protein L207DRAFT_530926 [Hyaloscypha variabilis F]|uniref:Uncharacterized protein n=1 Tax=Hyaloscypha variabilis (strain UAMH 11265 / GT02V1 / F) TaxID=1149755 RepID=A0A2J6RHK3_HYAVF|nr:hypothetical protein L207DRAFT_530926 [Hyaloscypha variabilis F]
MEISENSDMDLDLEFPSKNLQLNAQIQPTAEADPEVFWGRNLHASDPSHQMEFIDHMSKDMEAGGDLDISSLIPILTLTRLDITLDCDMTDMSPLDSGSEMEHLLDVFALAREDACELDIDQLPLFEYTMQPSGGTEVNADRVGRTQKEDGSRLELVKSENLHSEPDKEPVGEVEWCELHTFRDHLQEMGFNSYEDFDEESWDRVLKGLEADEESEAKPESRPNERGEEQQSTKRFKCTHTNCTKTFLYP